MSPSAVLCALSFLFTFYLFTSKNKGTPNNCVCFTFQRICCKGNSPIILDLTLSDHSFAIELHIRALQPTKDSQECLAIMRWIISYMKSLVWNNGILDYAIKSAMFTSKRQKNHFVRGLRLWPLLIITIHSFNRWTQIAPCSLRIYYYIRLM